MAKFKSTYNGTVLEFTNENDIAELRKHQAYVEITEEEDMATKKKPAPAPMPMKEKDMPMKKKDMPMKKGKKGC